VVKVTTEAAMLASPATSETSARAAGVLVANVATALRTVPRELTARSRP
jgi:hypothetical protein